MPSTISGFSYVELNDSGRGAGGEGTPIEPVKIYRVAWADFPAFIRALRGGYTSTNGANWSYTLPDEHPDWPGRYCLDYRYEGIGATSFDGAKSSWEYARIEATYKPLKFDPSQPETIQEESFDASIEMISLDENSHKEASDSTPVTKSQKILVPLMTYNISYTDIPTLPNSSGQNPTPIPGDQFSANAPDDNIQVIYGLLGKVNSGRFKGAEPGQMMFLGGQGSRVTTIYDTLGWRLQLKFLYRPINWNYGWSASKGEFVSIVTATGANELYLSGDFSQLLPR